MTSLIITCDEPPRFPLNGNNRKAFEVIQAVQENYRVHIIAYPTGDSDWRSLQDQWTGFNVECHRHFRREAFRHVRSLGQRLSLPTISRDFDREFQTVRNIVGREGASKILIDFISGAPLLNKASGSGIVLSGHDCMSYLFEQEMRWANRLTAKFHYWFRRQFALNAERRFAHLAKRVHLVSERDALEFSRVNRRVQTTVIPIGGSMARSSDLIPYIERSRKLIWGNLGSELIAIGLKSLLEAIWESGIKRMTDWHIIGKLPKDEALRLIPRILDLGLQYSSAVEKIGEFLGDTKVLVLPDAGGTGQKNRTLDGMSHGCCVMGLSEVFRGIPGCNGERGFEFDSYSALGKAMFELELYCTALCSHNATGIFDKNFSSEVLNRMWCGLLGEVGDYRGFIQK
jgi:hypothetical protein